MWQVDITRKGRYAESDFSSYRMHFPTSADVRRQLNFERMLPGMVMFEIANPNGEVVEFWEDKQFWDQLEGK